MTEIQTKYAAIAINTIRERQTDTCRKQGQRNVDNSNITYYNIINPSPRNPRQQGIIHIGQVSTGCKLWS